MPDVTHFANQLLKESRGTSRETEIEQAITEAAPIPTPAPTPAPTYAPVYTYNRLDATPEDIKAGYSLDRKEKWWPNGVWGVRPERKINITSNTDFKYSWWRRIEEIRNVYSATGILLIQNKKYTWELVAYPITLEQQREACNQLLEATVEYGNVCPYPFTQRWIETTHEEIIEAQNFINNLYDFFNENKIIDFVDEPYRKQVLNFVTPFSNKDKALDILNKSYRKHIFNNRSQIKSITKRINKAER